MNVNFFSDQVKLAIGSYSFLAGHPHAQKVQKKKSTLKASFQKAYKISELKYDSFT